MGTLWIISLKSYKIIHNVLCTAPIWLIDDMKILKIFIMSPNQIRLFGDIEFKMIMSGKMINQKIRMQILQCMFPINV